MDEHASPEGIIDTEGVAALQRPSLSKREDAGVGVTVVDSGFRAVRPQRPPASVAVGAAPRQRGLARRNYLRYA